MKILRAVIAFALVLGLTGQAVAGDLAAAAAKAAADDTQPTTKRDQFKQGTSKNTLLWAGAGVFAAGMTVALYGFINDKNGKYSEFGEATSSNKPLGAAGISAAFAGGTLMFLGARRAKFAPSVQAGPRSVKVTKQLSW